MKLKKEMTNIRVAKYGILVAVSILLFAQCTTESDGQNLPVTNILPGVDPTTGTTVNLSWDNPTVSGFTGVSISWSPAGGTSTNPLELPSSASMASIVGLERDTSYRFTITAQYSSGNSPAANPVDVMTLPDDNNNVGNQNLPVTNISSSVDPTTGTTVNLSWSNPTADGFTGVSISWSPAGGTTTNPLELASPAAMAVIVGLQRNVPYRFTITAQYSNGQSPSAIPVNVMTLPAPTNYLPISNLDSTPDANGRLVLDWTNPTAAGFEGVRVSWTPSDGTPSTPINLASTQSTTTISGLDAGTVYSFMAVARYSGTNASPPVSLAASIPPPMVTSLTAVVTGTRVTLRWTNPTLPGFKGTQITWNPADGNPSQPLLRSATAIPSANISGLTAGVQYTFSVVSRYGTPVVFSQATEVRGTAAATPITGLTVERASNTAVRLSWTNPGGSGFTGVAITEASLTAIPNVPSSQTSTIISGLTRGSTYNFQVSAMYGAVQSTAVAASAITIPQPMYTAIGVSKETPIMNGITSPYSCAIHNASAWCWGSGGAANGDVLNQNSAVPIQIIKNSDDSALSNVTGIAVGEFHSCAISAGSVYCWGVGASGRLGDGNVGNINKAVRVCAAGTTVPVPFSGCTDFLESVTAIAAGSNHTCAISAGSVYCWGSGADGRLGNNSTANSLVPMAVSNVGGATGALPASQISVGDDHACAISGGTPYCWGRGLNGRLGDGSMDDNPIPAAVSGASFVGATTWISAGTRHSCLVAVGAAYCWGDNDDGQIGIAKTGNEVGTTGSSTADQVVNETTDVALPNVLQISAGESHTCAITNANIYCWGANGSSRLGDGTTNLANRPVAVLAEGTQAGNFGTAAQVSAGAGHTCAIRDNIAYCWGGNIAGQLGDGSMTLRNRPTEVLVPSP